MKTNLAPWLVLTLAACGLLRAEVPPDLRTTYLETRDTPRGKVPDILLSGDTWTNLGPRDDLVRPFQMKSFRSGQVNEVQLIGQAPECHLDRSGGRAWDAGPVVLFTPTTNVWLQGEGYLFIEPKHLLFVSNKVETRVLRSLLKTTMMGSGGSNAPGAAERVLKIFSSQGQFDYESNVAVYLGGVHVIDAQLDLTSERLTVHFTTNGAVENILAEENVVMTTTNKGQATAPRAFYYVTNGNEMTELTGEAAWTNGDERATAEKFIYDSTRHFLTGDGHVRVWWPNAPQRPGFAPKADAATGYRELWADLATLQWPLTNGPVEAMHATGNVIIVNQADQSRATGEQADYTRTNDLFELTGDPVWWNDQMEIKGRVLTAELTNQVYHARGDANFKHKGASAAHPDQWLYIASADLDYHTNRAVFHDDVRVRLLEDGVLRDTLTSASLEVELFSNAVTSAVARGNVRGETAPDKLGKIKTVACDTLTMRRSPASGLIKDVVAQDHVVLREFESDPAAPRNQLTAVTVTAFFSAVTNQVERVVAVRNVVFDQIKTNQTVHATGQEAVYTAANDETRLTGQPVARTERYLITDASCLIWQSKSNRFSAFGPFTMSNPNSARPSSKP
jgi:lipopolysaccharide export system protein LptA